ncbi:gene transfer agent family protein [Rhizobium laguerreae]|uniref:gene transfer agent family protein n=1 Tax=Rhizobium laguerreae TaxID=1076926 RepID=UPI001C91751D|nr:gene transfer agent family protein [Rhizobium laguerreae]MBY3255581.1 gene transfer agent family protein [Rhizobium laguerreae]MBY3268406.1 gene transfer agent family protein [Rhizobium laguerreae]MBY3282620.1 gene transfer agent family protein [Rhizobium laguerreae]MBY3288974.1 gene transfer agent family protein [Rhizobium laguerreae]MBY3564127.1 gene transfer agent family protein [Rhizobium laguerreae]
MSRDAKITLTWADGDYVFRLGWAEIAALQEAVDAGPYVVLNRLHTGQWRIEDISNVIRLGLIGGGFEPVKALKLIRTYVESRPPMENHPYAVAVLSAGLIGAPEEALGEGVAPDQAAE